MKNRNSTRPEDCTCKTCGKTFARSDNLKRHIDNGSCKAAGTFAPRPQSHEPATAKKPRIEAVSTQMSYQIDSVTAP